MELFAPHVNEDGLVNRVTTYSDLERKEPINERCTYRARHDLLAKRNSDFVTKQIVEKVFLTLRFIFTYFTT